MGYTTYQLVQDFFHQQYVSFMGGPKNLAPHFFARSMALGTGDDEVDDADEIGSWYNQLLWLNMGANESVASGGFRLWLEWLEGYMLVLESSDRNAACPLFSFLFSSRLFMWLDEEHRVFLLTLPWRSSWSTALFLTLNMHFFMDLLHEQRDDVF